MSHSDVEIRERVNKLLDFFTEPSPKEKYLRDLENDLVALIEEQTRLARIDELGMVQTLHGRYLTTTWVNERPMMIEHRIAQLSNTKEDI